MGPYIQLIFGVLIIGLLVWALKGLIMERTKKMKAGDQYLTQDEIEAHCGKEHKEVENRLIIKIEHLHELIKKDLVHGQAKFKKIEEGLDKNQLALANMNTTLVLIAQENGIKTK